jgi:hypothetical protein
MLTMVTDACQPEHADVVADLTRVRSAGLTRLRRLDIPALQQAARFTTGNGAGEDGGTVEHLLRRAVGQLGGGPLGEAAAVLYGLEGGTRGLDEAERRRRAAECFGRSFSTFRQRYEPDLINDLADRVLEISREGQLRSARQELERRHPTESRLAVQWVERFDAYYRLWTPIYALGADLTAYRSTLLETDRPYDRDPGSLGPDYPGETQEGQARGYSRKALFDFAWVLWELKQFMVRYGGHWLLSSTEAETAASDAVYGLNWHTTCFNDRDHSWLRLTAGDSGCELHPFLTTLAESDIGRATHEEWQEWVYRCNCGWDVAAVVRPADEYFPIREHHNGIEEQCHLHEVVRACNAYCDLVDREWLKIADWYHVTTTRGRGISGEALYQGIQTRPTSTP